MRVLMVGGGRRGMALATGLAGEGHAVRVVSRDASRRADVEAAGCQFWPGDPDRIGTLRYALDNVTVLLWLLGTATPPGDVEALHGSRLTMMLERVIDSTVRGLVYEAAGTVDAGTLAGGRAIVEKMATYNEMPFRVLEADPADEAAWVTTTRGLIDDLLTQPRGADALRDGRADR